MTVSTATSRVDYTGNGVTVAFPVPFPFITDAYLVVVRTIIATGVSTTLTLDSIGADGYSVTGAGDATGTVTVITAPTALQRLSIIRSVAGTQEADFVANDPFPAETFEGSLDKLQMQINDGATERSRSPILFDGDIDGSGRYNANGNRMADLADGVEAQDAATVNQLGEAASANAPFVQAGAGAVARTVQNKLRDLVSVKDFGAVGDGVTNDHPAFALALAAAREVFVPAGSYLLMSPLTIATSGQRLLGAGKEATTLVIGHTAGAGVVVAAAQVEVADLRIRATTGRAAYTTGGTYDLAVGQYGLMIYNNGGFLTQCRFTRVLIDGHPTHGVYMGGEGAGTVFSQCESQFNRGHGYMFDDRTLEGGTASRNGIVNMDLCRALDNGGNAVNLSQTGGGCYRFIITNLETLWNAWNTSIVGLENAEAYISTENVKVQQCAFGDIDADDRTVMGNGRARLAKTTLSVGVYVRASSQNIYLENNRYISTSKGVVTGASVSFLRVNGAYFTQQQLALAPDTNQTFGFDIGTNCANLYIDVPPSTAVTTMVTSNTLNAFPMVVNKNKSAGTQAMTALSTFESVTDLENVVYLPVGFYRIYCSVTVQNGNTETGWSMRFTVTNSVPTETNFGKSVYETVPISGFATLTFVGIIEITAAANYTVKASVRQGAGSLGNVLNSTSTFGATFLQIERVR